MAPCQLAEPVFIDAVADAEQDELHILMFEEFVEDTHDEVEPFRLHKTRYHSDQRRLPFHRQIEYTLQGGFVVDLLFHRVLYAVVLERIRQIFICCRIV